MRTIHNWQQLSATSLKAHPGCLQYLSCVPLTQLYCDVLAAEQLDC